MLCFLFIHAMLVLTVICDSGCTKKQATQVPRSGPKTTPKEVELGTVSQAESRVNQDPETGDCGKYIRWACDYTVRLMALYLPFDKTFLVFIFRKCSVFMTFPYCLKKYLVYVHSLGLPFLSIIFTCEKSKQIILIYRSIIINGFLVSQCLCYISVSSDFSKHTFSRHHHHLHYH